MSRRHIPSEKNVAGAALLPDKTVYWEDKKLIKLRKVFKNIAAARYARRVLRNAKCRQRGYYAQHGEDRFILSKFKDAGFYIDVGANDPHFGSNTFLLYKAGWRGITIDPIRSLVELHRRYRPRDIQVNAGISDADGGFQKFFEMESHPLSTFDARVAEGYVEGGATRIKAAYDVAIRSLGELISEHGIEQVDLISIDVEGFELQALKGFCWEKLKPKMLMIEMDDYFGGLSRDAEEVTRFVEALGYTHAESIGVNQAFILST